MLQVTIFVNPSVVVGKRQKPQQFRHLPGLFLPRQHFKLRALLQMKILMRGGNDVVYNIRLHARISII
jgi:hypothetical protein